jgi:hypothetical protein
MTRSVRLLAPALLVGLLSILEGCAGMAGKSEKRLSNADLVLVSFGSINGELAPCG